MSLETKQVPADYQKKTDEIELRRAFGWRYVDDTHRGRTHSLFLILERDTEIKHYEELNKLEQRYDSLGKQYRTYFPITDSPEMFLLILLFLFPFVLYCIFKSNQKKRIAENNVRIKKEQADIVQEAKALL